MKQAVWSKSPNGWKIQNPVVKKCSTLNLNFGPNCLIESVENFYGKDFSTLRPVWASSVGGGGVAHIEQNRQKSDQECIIIINIIAIAIIIQQHHIHVYHLFRRRPENLSDRLILGTNKGASGWYARSNRVIMMKITIMIMMTWMMRMIKCKRVSIETLVPLQGFLSVYR